MIILALAKAIFWLFALILWVFFLVWIIVKIGDWLVKK